MTRYDEIKSRLVKEPRTWLITGVAGFIGSNLLEALLKLNQRVFGLDNFLTGYQRNLDEVQTLVLPGQWGNFKLIQGDIRNLWVCRKACESVDYVLHQAALGSVPRSMEDPITTNDHNLTGFLNIMVAARDAKVKRFVYASSSSVYGDEQDLPKKENKIGRPLSPYAVTKLVNETYADVFARAYNLPAMGLRYFNVFGPRQDPGGAYAAVVPKWFSALAKNEAVYINGDGETSRDFCFVENAVQANLLAAYVTDESALNQKFNIAYGERTTLNELFKLIQSSAATFHKSVTHAKPIYRDFRSGDIQHSLADISNARVLLGYDPQYSVRDGLKMAAKWYTQEMLTLM